MTDAEYAQQKARVEALIKRWVKPIGLGWWRIRFEWCRELRQEEQPSDGEVMRRTHFTCSSDWRYMDALIMVYLPALVSLDDDDLEQSFVHELCHIFVNELRGTGQTKAHEAREERVVTTLAQALVWLRDHTRDEVLEEQAAKGLIIDMAGADGG